MFKFKIFKMKISAFLILTATVFTFELCDQTIIQSSNNPKANANKIKGLNFMNELFKLNETVQALLSSSKNQLNPDKIDYFWDHINLVFRILLLKQINTSTIGYNLESDFLLNQTKLNWNMLPENVQLFLLNQKWSDLINLTYSEWAWVDSNSLFANITIFSLLAWPQSEQLTNILNVLDPLKYNQNINRSSNEKSLCVLFDIIFSLIKHFFPLIGKPPFGPYSRVSNGLNTFYNSVYSVKNFILTYSQKSNI